MTLAELQIGQTATILMVGGQGTLRQHFLDMGVLPGIPVTLVKYAPMGDPMELRIHNYELTLRKADAGQITVTPVVDIFPHCDTIMPVDPEPEHPGLGEGGHYHREQNEGRGIALADKPDRSRPLFMLFISNLLFLLVKVTNQINFYFVADLMFDTKYNVFIDVITFPGFLIAGIGVPKLVEKLGQRFDSRTFYRVCCVAAIVLHLLFFATCYNGYIHKAPGSPVSLGIGILTVLFTGLTAIPLECKNLMQKEMEAETVDYIEWKTGTRVEGIMLSIMSFTGAFFNFLNYSLIFPNPEAETILFPVPSFSLTQPTASIV